MPVSYSSTSIHPVGLRDFKMPQFLYITIKSLLTLWTVQPLQVLSDCR